MSKITIVYQSGDYTANVYSDNPEDQIELICADDLFTEYINTLINNRVGMKRIKPTAHFF